MMSRVESLSVVPGPEKFQRIQQSQQRHNNNNNKSIMFLLIQSCLVLLMFSSFSMVCTQPTTNNNQFQPNLRGLTVLRSPFIERESDGQLKGYFVDLLNELAAVGKFTYNLTDYPENDLARNELFTNRPTGVLQEVSRSRVDFAIADYLTSTINRRRYVDFTEPYLESNLSALVAKDRLAQSKVQTIQDLVDPNFQRPTLNEAGQPEPAREEILLSIYQPIYNLLPMSNDPLHRQIIQRLQGRSNSRVDDREVGVEQAMKTPIAFIQESLYNELAVDQHCELTHLKIDTITNSPDLHFEYGIIVPKTSLHLETLNKAIRELKLSGRLDLLKSRYWNQKCNGIGGLFEQYRLLLSMLCTLSSLSISLFILS